MNPLQRNKVDISSMSPEEQKLFRLYGKLPNRKDLLQKKFQERKYFDSGDYALSKAGKASDAGVTTVGSQHPQPENIPHLASPITSNGAGNILAGPNGSAGGGHPTHLPGPSVSPVKESRFKPEDASRPVEGLGRIDKTREVASEEDTVESVSESTR